MMERDSRPAITRATELPRRRYVRSSAAVARVGGGIDADGDELWGESAKGLSDITLARLFPGEVANPRPTGLATAGEVERDLVAYNSRPTGIGDDMLSALRFVSIDAGTATTSGDVQSHVGDLLTDERVTVSYAASVDSPSDTSSDALSLDTATSPEAVIRRPHTSWSLPIYALKPQTENMFLDHRRSDVAGSLRSDGHSHQAGERKLGPLPV